MIFQQQSVYCHLKRLWQHISPQRRRQFGLLLVLMILSSFAEILSIGAIMPFLAILTNPHSFYSHPSIQPMLQATGANLSIDNYRRALYQPFEVHIARNSSEVINGISGKSGAAMMVILLLLNLVSSVILLIAILFALLFIDVVAALATFGGFGLIYFFIIKISRNRLLINGKTIARESTFVIKSLQEGLGGIRDVLIDGSQAAYCQIYRNADQPMREAQGNSSFVSTSPRYVVEALGMLLITFIAYMLANDSDGIAKSVPVLGALALGAQRLLPVLQQAFSSWSGILSSQASLQDALDLLDQPLPVYADQPSAKALPFGHQIRLNQLSFRYAPQTPWVLMNLDLTILKGSRVGFIGLTGSGKSTLLDVVMGLLQPTAGALEIDGRNITTGNQRAWQAHIAHVPQAIFLADSSIEENIAFGVPKHLIDKARIREAAKQAQIAHIIENLPNKYQTFVGERGIRLSGGQRQRIGIARALYKKADVIIFDEATSALDNETEQAVMQAIESLSEDLTILIVAHRLTTLKNCTQIVELGHGGITRTGNYQEIVTRDN